MNTNLPENLDLEHRTLSHEVLPEELTNEIGEMISDYLSDHYGYCHKGFSWEMNIQVHDIVWDTTE